MAERFELFALGDFIDSRRSMEILGRTAMGLAPPDTVVTNGTVFNAFTGEFLQEQQIWIKEGIFTYVGPARDLPEGGDSRIIDAGGGVILPGLIDSHTHLATRARIEEFIRHIIPTGVTTVVTETTELPIVAGLQGFRTFIDGIKDQPIRLLYTISPLCGLTQHQERNAPSNRDLLEFLEDPLCLGVGEMYWGNALIHGPQGERVRELASMARSRGKHVDGHTSGARGAKLQAYTLLGPRSCHEPINETELLERLRTGYWVMIRHGGIRKELQGVRGVFDLPVQKDRLILCTDSVDPETILGEGYLDAAVREALDMGLDPALVYRMVTLHASQCFGLDGVLGSISPGRLADLVIVPSEHNYHPILVMMGGTIIYERGRNLVEPREWEIPTQFLSTVHLGELSLSPIAREGKARAMELVSRLVTREIMVDLSSEDELRDVLMVLALDRAGSCESFLGLIKGFGLQRGACGTTMCWDTTDMIIVGRDTHSMVVAAKRLQQMGGGAVYVIGEDVIASFPAPICGVLSLETMETAGEQMATLEKALRENGVPWEKPVLTLDVLGTAAIPHLRITHRGYVRLRDRDLLPLRP
jgi:adenine deaminase